MYALRGPGSRSSILETHIPCAPLSGRSIFWFFGHFEGITSVKISELPDTYHPFPQLPNGGLLSQAASMMSIASSGLILPCLSTWRVLAWIMLSRLMCGYQVGGKAAVNFPNLRSPLGEYPIRMSSI